MLRGLTPLSLDAKGRMAMPSRYRERLEECCAGHLIATINPDDRCLWLYPLTEWEVIEKKLIEVSSFDKKAARYKRMLMGHATECDIDNQGRILLPPTLRQFASLDKRIALVGQGNKFEIWDEDTWNKNVAQWMVEEEQEPSEVLKSLAL